MLNIVKLTTLAIGLIILLFVSDNVEGTIYTRGGNSNGAPCVFPFTYQDQEYWSCISVHYHTMWCSTTPDYATKKKWGLCGQKVSTEGGTANGTNCGFPFFYKGKNFTQCILLDHHRPWCSITYDYASDGKWGNCMGVSTPILDEERLHNYLMLSYMSVVRPTPPPERNTTNSKPIIVTVGLDVNIILEVDEHHQTIEMHIMLMSHWKDHRLTWDPSLYGGLTKTHIPYDDIWNPDIQLYNGVGASPRYAADKLLATVVSEGIVLVMNSMVIKAHCNFNMKKFPFDNHRCTIKYGSWSYFANEVDFKLPTHFTVRKESREWKVTRKSSKRSVLKFVNTSFTYLTFEMDIKRKSTYYYTYVYIVPGVILSFLAPLQFLMQGDTEGKTLLGVGIMICLSVMLSIIVDIIPVGDTDIPVLGKYYVSMMAMAAMTVLVTILLDCLKRCNSPMSETLRKLLVVHLGRLVCVNSVYFGGPAPQLCDIQEIAADDKPKDQTIIVDTNNADWQLAAIVINRVIFLVFVFVTIVCTFALLPY